MFSTPILPKMAVMAAKMADNSAKNCHDCVIAFMGEAYMLISLQRKDAKMQRRKTL
jgi:hypothetical protein